MSESIQTTAVLELPEEPSDQKSVYAEPLAPVPDDLTLVPAGPLSEAAPVTASMGPAKPERPAFDRQVAVLQSDTSTKRERNDSFGDIFDALQPRMMGYALAIVRHKGQAEEIVQEALLGIWRGFDSFDASRGNLEAWACGIVHNRAIDEVRKKNRRPVIAELGDDPEVLETAMANAAPNRLADPEEHLEFSEAVSVLGKLSSRYREVLVLGDVAGFSHRELAGYQGVALGTAKGRRRLARKAAERAVEETASGSRLASSKT